MDQTLKQLIKQLADNGVTSVEMDYSGYGDEGNTEALSYFPPVAKGLRILNGLEEGRLIELLEDTLPDGYDQNQGSQGKLILDVVNKTVAIHHEWNVTNVEEEIYTLDLNEKEEN